MSAYKQFTTSDTISVPFTVTKNFFFSGSAATGSNVGIEFYSGLNLDGVTYISSSEPTTGIITKFPKRVIYNSIRVLYYSNNISRYGDLTTSSYGLYNSNYNPYWEQYLTQFTGSTSSSFGRFDDYSSTTLYNPRYFPTNTQSIINSGSISVISVPTNLYGQYIIPRTFKLEFDVTANNSFLPITDDGEGNLYLTSGSDYVKVGNIFYSHGIAVITTGSATISSSQWCEAINKTNFSSGKPGVEFIKVSFSSSITLFENKYNCNIKDNEFGFSQNPSLISGSSPSGSTVYDFATGSYFSPYVTTVGLYNDDKELIAVAKLAKPLQCSSTTDTTIMVNFDLV
jgi:hypothetical protein